MKAIIFDSSTLISFAMNGLLPELKELKKIFKGKFLITEDVKRETIDKPITIKRFTLEALKIKQLIDEKIIEMPESVGEHGEEISKKTNEILERANKIFISKDKEIKIISSGEASCLALSRILTEKGIVNILAVDERTTRMLVENPEGLMRFLEKKMHTKIKVNKDNFKSFKGFKIIRSTELIYVAYKKKVVGISDLKLLDALLWAMKFKGCAISNEEIEEIKKIG